MIEGAVRHGTTMKVEGNYVDSHGQTEIGFGVTMLLGFDLLPRIKQINKVKLYRVESGEGDLSARRTPADPVDPLASDRTGLRADDHVHDRHQAGHRLHRGHPVPVRRLRLPPGLPGHAGGRPRAEDHLRRPLPAAVRAASGDPGRVNIVESSNGGNSVIFYGKGGDIATNRRESWI
ncbi:hypothetical protein GCM10020219_007360 [Nonomuraea dietziae]